MTEIDELLSRLRKLEPVRLDAEFKARVRERVRPSLRRPAPRRAPLVSFAAFATAIVYLGWALHFTRALQR